MSTPEAKPTAFREVVGADVESFYFGYGANMSVQSLAARGVKMLDPQGRPAVLRGHDLVFNIAPPSTSLLAGVEPAFGNVRAAASQDAEVHGVLHRVMGNVIHLLDTWEGPGYQRLSMPVIPYDEEEPVMAFVYIQTDPFPPNDLIEKPPGERYLRTLQSGAAISGLHSKWLDKLAQQSFFAFPRLELDRDSLPVVALPAPPTAEQRSELEGKPFWTVLDGILLQNVENHPHNHAKFMSMMMYRDATEGVMSIVTYTDSREEKMKFVHAILHVLIAENTVVGRLGETTTTASM